MSGAHVETDVNTFHEQALKYCETVSSDHDRDYIPLPSLG